MNEKNGMIAIWEGWCGAKNCEWFRAVRWGGFESVGDSRAQEFNVYQNVSLSKISHKRMKTGLIIIKIKV